MVRFVIQQLSADDEPLMNALLSMFGGSFEDVDTYRAKRLKSSYFRRLLSSDYFIALVAIEESEVIGGLAAYELMKFEQERSETGQGPEKTLARGFAIVRNDEGQTVTSSVQAQESPVLQIEFRDGPTQVRTAPAKGRA
jgi:hypothetical protein